MDSGRGHFFPRQLHPEGRNPDQAQCSKPDGQNTGVRAPKAGALPGRASPDSIASLILNHFHERLHPVRVYELFSVSPHPDTDSRAKVIFVLRRSEAAHEEISCAREHFLSHRGVW